MRTSILKHFSRGIFFGLTVLTLSACTGKNDLVLESVKQMETDAIPGAEGGSDIEQAPEADGADGRNAGSVSEESGHAEEAAVSENITGNAVTENALPDIYVHICGAVGKPGVYVLEAGSRVYQGIEAAGGFAEDACEDFVNQAGVLTDGQRIVIPTAEEAEAWKADGSYQEIRQPVFSDYGIGSGNDPGAGNVGNPGTGNPGGLVNINTATESELNAIPGIGAGKAAAIVKYRQENGAFASVEDIMKVSGIKEGTFEKIKDKITVN